MKHNCCAINSLPNPKAHNAARSIGDIMADKAKTDANAAHVLLRLDQIKRGAV